MSLEKSKEVNMSKSNEMDVLQREINDDARKFMLDGIAAEVPAMHRLDELASFYDGDPCALF